MAWVPVRLRRLARMKSLRARIVVSCAALLSLGVCLCGVVMYRLVERELRGEVDQLLKDKVVILSKSVNRKNPSEVWPQPKEMDRDRLGFFCQGWGQDRQFLWKTEALPEIVPLTRQAADFAWFYKDFVLETLATGGLGQVRVATYPVWHSENDVPILFAFVQCLKPLTATEQHLGAVAGWLTGGGALVVALGTLLVNTLVGRWLRSMSILAQTAQDIGRQAQLNRRLPLPEDDREVAGVAAAFNEMLDRLERVTGTQQKFLADASHELRTPLTILRGEIEVALRRDRTGDDYRGVLASNREEIERLSHLTDNLLTLARADAGHALGSPAPFDLAAVARAVANKLTPLASESGVRLQVEPDGPVMILGDAAALERVVFNLAENAVRHSPPDELVRLVLSSDNGEARLDVIDAGAGIPPEHLPHVFGRFYRIDSARTRATGGAGLGLAIVKSLVEAHAGRVRAASQVGRGSTFTIWLRKGSGGAPGGGQREGIPAPDYRRAGFGHPPAA